MSRFKLIALFTTIGLLVGHIENTLQLKGQEETPVEAKIPPGRAAAILPDVQLFHFWPLGV